MKYFVSDLIVGMGGIEDFGAWVSSVGRDDFGAEFSAFTHDDAYWTRLAEHVVPACAAPMTFHGPYVNIEATSPLDSPAHAHLMESYRRVFALAARYGVRHVVFHYSQLHFAPEAVPAAQKNACAVMRALNGEAHALGVRFVIENLCRHPEEGTHLFTNEEYFRIFEDLPDAEALIDIGHANVNGLDVERFLAQYGPRVRGFHVHNNDGLRDLHRDYHNGTADIRAVMRWAGQYTDDADIVIEYEPHEHLTHAELLEEIDELKSWVEEGARRKA